MLTPYEYLLADIAGRYGNDKISWTERALWTSINKNKLETLVDEAKEPILFSRAVRALRDVEAGKPTGHGVMFDASASGLQLLSIMTGDVNGAFISNVTGDSYTDPYEYIYNAMFNFIDGNAVLERDDVKTAIMTSLYGSEAEPEKLFQGGTLKAFYAAMEDQAPKCWELNTFILDFLKQSDADSYDWVMPDNFHVHCPVTETIYEEVECLGEIHIVGRKVQQAHIRNRGLGAHLTHSVEAFLARELNRRANIGLDLKKSIYDLILNQIANIKPTLENTEMVKTLWGLYKKSGFLSARILQHLDKCSIDLVCTDRIMQLLDTIPDTMFSIMSVHD